MSKSRDGIGNILNIPEAVSESSLSKASNWEWSDWSGKLRGVCLNKKISGVSLKQKIKSGLSEGANWE